MKFKISSRGIGVYAGILLALSSPTKSFSAEPPPPPGGPPPPVLAKIEINGPVLVDEGTTANYTCTATYSDGTKAAVAPSWSVDSPFASIDSAGELVAGDVTSDEPVNISATFGGKTATINATILYAAPVLKSLVVSGPTSLAEGSGGAYSCTAHYSDGSVVSIVPAWSVLSTIATIDNDGNLLAGSVDSDRVIDVIASFDGLSESLSVTITDVPVVLLGLAIQGAVSMNENTTIQLHCVASYSDGSQPLVNPVWSDNSSYAQIGQDGKLAAGNVTADRGITVSASYGGMNAYHNVLIKYVVPNLERIEISGPGTVSEGSSATYSCVAYYDDGTSQGITPSWSENSSYATVEPSGSLTALDVQSDQTLTLSAAYQGKTASMQVTILYDVPTLLSVTIDGATIVEEHKQTRYTCTGSYSDGTSKTVAPLWNVSAFAEIDADGWLMAGEVGKDETVTVSASLDGVGDTFEVLLKDVPPPVVLESLAIIGATEVMERDAITLSCQATYSDGSTKDETPVWSTDSSLASVDLSGTFAAGNFGADTVVQVTASFGGLTATHTVSVWMIGNQIVYPLSGMSGSDVMIKLYDNETGLWTTNGPFSSPSELVFDELESGQWYWVSVLESNAVSNAWVEVQGNWLNM